MRHKVKSTTINRSSAELKALLRNVVSSLILHESIKTTMPKAKLASSRIDRLITRAKLKDKASAIRYVSKYLFTKEVSKKLIEELAQRYQNRDSWFTRIIKLEKRKWDDASLVQLQFV